MVAELSASFVHDVKEMHAEVNNRSKVVLMLDVI
jgi:hypothetical protein